MKTTVNGNGGCDYGGTGLSFPSQQLSELTFPVILKLVHTLHACASHDRQDMTRNIGVLLGLRRSEILLLLPNPPDSSSRQMDQSSLWLDRSQLWLSSLWGHAYTIIEGCTKQGIAYRDNVIDNFAQAVLFNAERIPTHQMKLYIRHVISPFVQYAPRGQPYLLKTAQILGRMYSVAAFHVERALVSSTERALEIETITAAGAGLLSFEQREIVEEATRLNAVDALLVHLQQLLSDHCHPAADKGKDEIFVSPLTMYFLNMADTAIPIIRILYYSLVHGSGSLAKKAAGITDRVLQANQRSSDYQQATLEHFLPATLHVLGIHGQHSDYLPVFTTLLV